MKSYTIESQTVVVVPVPTGVEGFEGEFLREPSRRACSSINLALSRSSS